MNPLSGKGDIALYRLRYPALNGAPLPLYTGSSEVGQVGFIVGFGTTGTGRSGGVNYDGLPRAGQNMIDLASSTQFHGVEVGNERILAIDFDSPDAKSSACGSPNPLQAEYSTSFGDSGGPLLVYSGGRFRIAGITSGGLPKPGRNASSYGELATFTRVSPYANWIRRVMNGQEPSIYEAFSSGALTANQVGNAMAARRAREFAMNQRGLRTAVYVDRLTPNDGFPLPALFTSVKTYQPFTPDGLPPFLRSSIFSGSTQASPPRPIRETSCTPCESVTVVPFPEQHDVPSVLVRNDLR